MDVEIEGWQVGLGELCFGDAFVYSNNPHVEPLVKNTMLFAALLITGRSCLSEF